MPRTGAFFCGVNIMDDITISILTQIIYAAITFAAGYSWNKSKSLVCIEKNMQKGIGVILKIELRRIHSRGMRKRFITYDEESMAEEIYTIYHALGLNGQGTAMIHDLRKLPKREDCVNAKTYTRNV